MTEFNKEFSRDVIGQAFESPGNRSFAKTNRSFANLHP